ncbi:MAG: hypothetical protein NTV86_16615 [Planctomycetota bacterium]|nr:hypothetical protein [Planctomycetota bacterium]
MAVRKGLMFLIGWCFLWGLGVLVLRQWAGVDRGFLLWGLAGGVPALAAGWVFSRASVPAESAFRAALDAMGGHGGLLMASGETDVGDWQGRIGPVRAPAVRWRFARPVGVLAVSAAFVAACLLLPDRYVAPAQPPAIPVERQVGQLSREIDALAKERVMEARQAESLKEKLAAVSKEAAVADPVKAWQALDHVEETVASAAKAAAQERTRQAEQAGRCEALGKALQQAGGGMDAQQLAEAMGELAKLANQAAKDNPDLQQALSRELSQACSSGKLSPEQVAQLTKAMSEAKDSACQSMAALAEAGLVDAESLSACTGAGEVDAQKLGEMLARGSAGVDEGSDGDSGEGVGQEGAASLTQMLDDASAGAPGRGAPTRGRGDAAMTWTKGTEPAGEAFKEQSLPPGAAASLRESKRVGISLGEHAKPTGPAAGSGGALGGAQAGGGAANVQNILPRHRGAVERYFDRTTP